MRYRLFLLTIFLLLVFQPILGARDIYIPTPFQTTKEAEQEMVLNGVRHRIQQYQSRLSPSEILDFYTEYLSQDGWEMNELNLAEQAGYEYEFESDYESDENLPELKATLFTKGEDMILLTFTEPMGAKTNYVLNYSYGRTQVFDDKDSPGEDLAFIPRYPGSIRYTSIESEGVTMLNYRSKDTKEQIERFYQRQMAGFGWSQQGKDLTFKEKMSKILTSGPINKIPSFGLMFESERGHCVINVAPIEELNLNNITITFIPEGE